MPDNLIQERMLETVEAFHYSQKFKGQLFSFMLGQQEYLAEILTDLRILQSSHIKTLCCCPDSRGLFDKINEWQSWGYCFDYIRFLDTAWEDRIQSSLKAERTPVLAIPNNEERILPPSPFHQKALAAIKASSTRKIFFLSKRKGLVVDNKFRSHPNPEEIKQYLTSSHKINVGIETLNFLVETQRTLKCDVVLLETRPGVIFQEVFTHQGAGTLFSHYHHSTCRQAQLSDVRNIFLLMAPHIKNGLVLPTSEDQIAAQIASYHLVEVNGELIASAKLSYYDRAVEIAKLCSLPRHRGKGRARELVRQMIEIARQSGKELAFALTVETQVGFFLRGLGFSEIDRANLPASWREQYDFSRPSQAFALRLSA